MTEKARKKVGGKYATMLNHLAVSISSRGPMRRKYDALSTLFNVKSLKSISLSGELFCLPRKKNEHTQIDADFFYARIATDKVGAVRHKHFLVIEKYADKSWQLEKLISLEKISSIEFEGVSEMEDEFDVVITVPEINSIVTPKLIRF